MSEAEPRIAQEGTRQGRLLADACEAAAQRLAHAGEIGRADVGQFTRLDITPDLLERIRLRGIGGQSLYGEPDMLPVEIRPHVATLVTAQTVANQHDPASAKVPLGRADEGHRGPLGIRAGVGVGEEAAAATVPAKRQGARYRQPLPVPLGMCHREANNARLREVKSAHPPARGGSEMSREIESEAGTIGP